jgi:hypothetical protein
MAQLAVQDIYTVALDGTITTGAATTYVAADVAGDTFTNDINERTWLEVITGATACTVTITPIITSVRSPQMGRPRVAPIVVAVPINQAVPRKIGPFPAAFNDSVSNVRVTYSAVTSVTVAAVRCPRMSP